MEVGLGPGDIVLDGNPPSPKRRTAAPTFWPMYIVAKRAGWIKMPLGMDVGLGSGHILLDGDPAPPAKRGTAPPIFGRCMLWPNGWMDQDATRPKRHRVTWEPSSPPKKRAQPQFSAHVYWSQTAGWITMPLGREVGLGPGDFVLDGDPASPLLKGYSPIFVQCPLWPNDWMDEDATWHGSRPRPKPHCVRRGPALRERGTAAPHVFGPCLLWPLYRPSQLLLSSC